jgi:D-tyrosyl-tRNA(Tyr) deacylase
MKAIVQRVDWAEVNVDGEIVGRVEKGLLVYAGVARGDTAATAEKLAEKIANLRIFEDEQEKLNLSVRDARGGVLVISNFTLLADARKGRRPAFIDAAPHDQARPVHEALLAALRQQDVPVAAGEFGAHMNILSAANGPVNILLDVPSEGGFAASADVQE